MKVRGRRLDWADSLAMEEARFALEDAVEELDDRILQEKLENILWAMQSDAEILLEDLAAMMEAAVLTDSEELGYRLIDGIRTLRTVYGIEEEER